MSDPISPAPAAAGLSSATSDQPSRERLLGAGLCTLSAFGFATLSILGKLAFANGMSLTGFLSLRFGGAALVLAAYLLATRRGRRLPDIGLAAILFGLGALGYFTQSSLYFLGLERVSASLASVLLYVYPIFVALLAWAVNHRPPGRGEWVAMALALAGVVLTVSPSGGASAIDGLGVAFVIGAAAGYSIYILVSDRYAPRAGPLMSTVFITAGASVSFAVTGGLTHSWAVAPSIRTGGILLGMIFLSTLLPVITFLAGLARVGPTAASLLSTLEPVFTVSLAAAILHEGLSPVQFIGAGLVLAAVILVNLPGRRSPAPKRPPSA